MKKITFALIILLYVTKANAQWPYTLPKLNYNYAALEPFVDSQTMFIHYGKHHTGYVNNLNKAIEQTEFKDESLEELLLNISHANETIRNNAGGHYNHSLFWEILSPDTATMNSNSDFSKACVKEFGSFDAFKKQMSDTAAKRFGSGWAWLSVTPDGNLEITSTANQDNPLMDIVPVQGIPVLGIDVWEHAYYLKYQNRRGDYLAAIWKIIDWNEVNKKYTAALKSPLLKRLPNSK